MGELRYYFDLPEDLDEETRAVLSSLMFEITYDAEDVSTTICERCGAAGERRRTELGWQKTLCDDCAAASHPRYFRPGASLGGGELQAAA
ncbi:MAG: hypothetical protein ACYDGN_09405 [Acidimicrobiales bacterium]